MGATPPTESPPGREAPGAAEERIRLRLLVRGVVQGVGFRPFVYRLADRMALPGWVLNGPTGVEIEVEGPRHRLEEFAHRLVSDAPAQARIHRCASSYHAPAGFHRFEIRESETAGEKTVPVLPDVAACGACLDEIKDPAERRHRYPFTNCTNCGPRFTIIRDVPYDRPNTSMAAFSMCDRCLEEYDNPGDRRFHAQPIACPRCGPALAYLDSTGTPRPEDDPLSAAARDIREGLAVAVKGLGGFHIMVDAWNAGAITRLREKKPRKEKPFALMFPSVEEVANHCHVGETEARLLRGPVSPIVLLRRKNSSALPEVVAPGNPCLGGMLPYTPLHALLLEEVGRAVVATSGNLSDEPICTENAEAVARLGPVVDRFLVHDRPIVRHADDSVVRVMEGEAVVLRRARGLAPLPLLSGTTLPDLLAFGADLKNAVGISRANQIVLSQHVGDLAFRETLDAFARAVEDLQRLLGWTPRGLVADLHPGYVSTTYAEEYAAKRGLPLARVQHHHAHMAACMLENDLDREVLGVTWDGTGYGTDGTIWGGEFLVGGYAGFRRVAHLRPFPLIGGDQAVQEPRRSALGVLHATFGSDRLPGGIPALASFSSAELEALRRAIDRNVNVVRTTSAGRLFDAVASLTGLKHRVTFEAQAAMLLEYAGKGEPAPPYPFRFVAGDDCDVLDWEPMIREIVSEPDPATVSDRFHASLAEMIVQVALKAETEHVVLSGGVFQNVRLLEHARARLKEAGFRVFSHRKIPPNDGGIAAGQIMVAAHGGEVHDDG